MSNFLQSKKLHIVLWALAGLIICLLIFGFGMMVGSARAGFVARFNENYYRNFNGPPGPLSGMMGPNPVAMHGLVGTVINVGSSTITIEDPMGNEQFVGAASGTVFRESGNDISIGEIKIGDRIAAIGEPDTQGKVQAHFIKVFAESTSSKPTQ
jgi:hypothetical protein